MKALLILAFCLSASAADYTIVAGVRTAGQSARTHPQRGKRLEMTKLAAAYAEGFWRARGYDVPDLTIEWTITGEPWAAMYDACTNIVHLNAWSHDWHRGGRTGIYDEIRRRWDADLNYALCHEFGHACGLGHSTEPGSVMQANFPVAAEWRDKKGPEL